MMKICKKRKAVIVMLFCSSMLCGQNYVPIHVEAQRWVKEKSNMPWETFETRIIDNLIGFSLEKRVPTNKYGSDITKKYKATGFFRVEKQGDRWWTIDPEGYHNVPIGINSVNCGRSEGTQKAFEQIYKSTERWMKVTADSLLDNGFNGTGSWSDIEAIIEYNRSAKQPLTYTPNLNFMMSYGRKRGGTYQVPGNTGYPNQCIFVFDPEFETFCMEYAQHISKYASDKNLFGFFSDNELPINMNNLEGYLKLENKEDPGYMAARRWMDERGLTIDKLSNEDKCEFAGYVAEKYYSIVSKALKTYAPNHMFLGSRLHGRVTRIEQVLRAAGKYCDIISINYYGKWTPENDAMTNWERYSKRPFMIPEFYTKAMDSGLTNETGAGFTVHTQRDRGYAYQNFCLGLLESKSCVGWHFFKYQDNDPTAQNVDPSNLNSNKGIVSNRYVYYSSFLIWMKQLNRNVYSLISYLGQ